MSKRVSFGSTMDKELMNKLKKLSEDTKVPLSKLLDASVEALFLEMKRWKKPNDEQYSESNQSNNIKEEVTPYYIGIKLPNEN